jgi:hypothetical protein
LPIRLRKNCRSARKDGAKESKTKDVTKFHGIP